MVVIVALEPLLLVFPWPCCSTRAGGALGRQTGAQPPVGLLGDFGGFFFPAMEKAKCILGVRVSSSRGMAAMAAVWWCLTSGYSCLQQPHIWA